VVIPVTPGAHIRTSLTLPFIDEVVAAAEGGDGSWAGIVMPRTPRSPTNQVGSPRAGSAVISPKGARCQPNPGVRPIAEVPESQPRKVMRLKETFEKRADFAEKPTTKTPRLPWAGTETSPGQFKAWEEVQARVEAVIAKRVEELSGKLVKEQGDIQATVQRALDLAEESNKACSKMAQQLEELDAAILVTVPQVDESMQEKVEEMMWKVEAEHADEVKGSKTMPKTVAAVFDDLHGRLEEWVSAIEGRIYNVEQVIWSAVSLADTAKPSASGTTGATAGDIEVVGGSKKLFSGDCAGETTENTDSSCQAEAKQSTNVQTAVRECTQRLGHVEFDMVHVKDDMKAQAVALEVIQNHYQVQQKLLKVNDKHHKHHEMKLSASNHGASVEIKARQPSVGASVEDHAWQRKPPVPRLISRGDIKTLRSATPGARVSSKSGHEGTVSIRVAAAPDTTTTLQHQPQQGLQAQQQMEASQQPQHHRHNAAVATLGAAFRWGMLSSGAVPMTSRPLSPSNSHAAVPAQLHRKTSAPVSFGKLANPTAALWPTNHAGPKAVSRDCFSSPELHQRA